jgi:hypothetical protein
LCSNPEASLADPPIVAIGEHTLSGNLPTIVDKSRLYQLQIRAGMEKGVQIESPDGKFIYYTKALGGIGVWRLAVEGGQATKVLENLNELRNLVIVNKGIHFVPSQD